MPANKWLDRTQPQTLYLATIVLYINAAFGLITGEVLHWYALLIVAEVLGALGIANERKVGYWAAVAAVAGWVAVFVFYFSVVTALNLLLYVALLALLLHPQSRSYVRTWFK
jgi:hypothetical protein